MAMIWAVVTTPGSGSCLSESLLLLPQGQVLPLLVRAAQPSVTPTEPHPHSGVSWTHLLLTVEKEHLDAYGNEIPSWLDVSGAMKIPQGCSAAHGEVWHPPPGRRKRSHPWWGWEVTKSWKAEKNCLFHLLTGADLPAHSGLPPPDLLPFSSLLQDSLSQTHT